MAPAKTQRHFFATKKCWKQLYWYFCRWYICVWYRQYCRLWLSVFWNQTAVSKMLTGQKTIHAPKG